MTELRSYTLWKPPHARYCMIYGQKLGGLDHLRHRTVDAWWRALIGERGQLELAYTNQRGFADGMARPNSFHLAT